MVETGPAPATRHCVWMNAGLLSYRLCDRAFDCEHCLLDAAMRGDFPSGADSSADGAGAILWIVPDDRLYSPGHAWIQAHAADPGIWRLGLDAFAAAVIGRVNAIHWLGPGTEIRPGDPIFRIDAGVGSLQYAAPLPGRIVRRNDALHERPGRIVTNPYDSGWILEIDLADPSALLRLLSPAAARQRLTADWRQFRQAVALHLLAGRSPCSGLLPIGLPVTDVRFILGEPDYFQLVQEFVH
jgi:glycine cleavage system H protein